MKRVMTLALFVFTACAGAASEEAGNEPVPASAEPTSATTEPSAALSVFENDEGLSGYQDSEGKVVIPAQYMVAEPFTGEVAAVAGDAGWVFIDKTGKVLASAFVFDNGADEFVEDRARIVAEDKYGFIATNGEIVVAPTWSFAERFAGGHAAVCEGCVRKQDGEHFSMSGGKWGYIDASGKLAIAPRFDQAGPFAAGQATVREGDREFVIGVEGSEQK